MVASRPSSSQQSPKPSSDPELNAEYYKYRLRIDHKGQKVPPAFLSQVREVRVEESLYQTSRFTIILDNPYGPGWDNSKPGEYTDMFEPGDDWSIYFTASQAIPAAFQPPYAGRVIRGKATRIEADFNNKTQGPIKIIGYDRLYFFHEGTHNRTFIKQKHSEIVEQLAKDVGLTKFVIDDTGFEDEYVFQVDETNMQFITKLAALNGYEFFIQCDDQKKSGQETLYFRKPQPIGQRISLTWGQNIRRIQPRYIKLPIDFIHVPFWDYEKKELYKSQKSRKTGTTSTQTGWKPDVPSVNGTGTLKVPGAWHTASPEKADRVNQSLCNEFQGQFMCAEVEAEGNATIRPGRIVHLPENQKGPIGKFAGNYYVTETCQHYKEGVLTTYFTIADSGGYSLLAHNLSTEHRLKPGQTNLVGLVTDNVDPKNMGRVKVKFPSLENQNSYWARMVMPGAGANRGFDCLPEINDEVMVAFEHGDIHRPYIIGGVWNGKDKPPEPVKRSVGGGKVRLRTFKTRVGHQMQFVDDNVAGRNKGIYIETAGGLKIEMDDQKKSIFIEVPGGGHIKLDSFGVSING
jgi:Type VI secretion system/phage-baseplate injector OB domain/Phage tail baseplate hub (GPD)